MALLAALGVGGCERGIPLADGPLQLVIRHPAGPVPRTDSLAIWGSLGNGRATLRVAGRAVPVERNGAFLAWIAMPRGERPAVTIEARLDGRVERRTVAVPLTAPAPPAAIAAPVPVNAWVRLRRLPSDSLDRATLLRPVYGRVAPGGALLLPIPLGVRLPADLRTADAIRVRPAPDLSVWIPTADADTLATPLAGPLALGDAVVLERDSLADLAVTTAEPRVTTVELLGRTLRWTVLGARHTDEPIRLPTAGALIRGVTRHQPDDARAVFDVELAAPPLGWRVRHERGRLVLRVRAPWRGGLRGLRVALDAGHPPAGSTGPTGLREDAVTLAVARRAAERLRRAGAVPILVRDTPRALSLEARPARAEAADAHLFVSIHLNAPADGRPPAAVDGTETFYLQPTAAALAHAVQAATARRMAQRDRGVTVSNLAVLRSTWMPSVLVEGTALVLPAREAWLRTKDGVSAYADGLVDGITRWATAR